MWEKGFLQIHGAIISNPSQKTVFWFENCSLNRGPWTLLIQLHLGEQIVPFYGCKRKSSRTSIKIKSLLHCEISNCFLVIFFFFALLTFRIIHSGGFMLFCLLSLVQGFPYRKASLLRPSTARRPAPPPTLLQG